MAGVFLLLLLLPLLLLLLSAVAAAEVARARPRKQRDSEHLGSDVRSLLAAELLELNRSQCLSRSLPLSMFHLPIHLGWVHTFGVFLSS
jgi:hypothetical protein